MASLEGLRSPQGGVVGVPWVRERPKPCPLARGEIEPTWWFEYKAPPQHDEFFDPHDAILSGRFHLLSGQSKVLEIGRKASMRMQIRMVPQTLKVKVG